MCSCALAEHCLLVTSTKTLPTRQRTTHTPHPLPGVAPCCTVSCRLAPSYLDALPQQQMSYAELVAQVSERILALTLQLPALSDAAKQTFIQLSCTLMQESAAYGRTAADANATQQQLEQPAVVSAAVVPAAPVAAAAAGAVSSAPLNAGSGGSHVSNGSQSGSGAVALGRSLAVAQVAADLVRSAAAPCLPLHLEDRWAFINLAAELLRP